MFNITQFRSELVIPVLSQLQMYSKVAEELLVFTCAVESDGGTFFKQVKGPALGIYQCEPRTHEDLWRNFIVYRNDIVTMLSMNFGVTMVPNLDRLKTDLRYATAIARLHYFRVKEALPKDTGVDGIWEYYKKYYNTESGKATKGKATAAYKKFCENT